MPRGGNSLVAGIEPQHYLAEADQIPLALLLRFNVQF
jgi:hypothetical protein